ncbi:MAG TPA: tRNA (adenosine(37)-N6)-dimethylallyltransferase MiaA [Acidobacteriota bacterium]|nr:tRNA (adenosine(37)-N6)-dimethylallyltransferase MiaA [Acidobacteriota bacterium]
MSEGDYPGLVVLGPTASGKTQLGLAMAERFRGEIISCDALQVYRHMDIGTAKATASDRARVLHHGLDLKDPGEDFSAGDYQRISRESLTAIRGRGALPLVVGGTGFYLRALIDGLFEGPGRSDALRTRMRRIISRRGTNCLYDALRRVDPGTAGQISPTDSARIIRAYEIYLLTGRPMSWWQCRPRDALRGYRWLKLGITVPRPLLYERINRRVEEMFDRGFVEEVKGLLERYPRNCQAFKAIGYREIASYLEGRLTLQQAREETQQESRRYAKRQMTWFRSDPNVVWLDGEAGTAALEVEAARLADEFLACRGVRS